MSASQPAASTRLVPEWAWWPLAILASVACAYVTLMSIQLAATLALVGLVVGLYLRSRTAGLAAMWALWLLVPLIRRLIGLSEGFGDADPLAVAPFAATGLIAAVELRRTSLSIRAKRVLFFAAAGFLFGVPIGVLIDPLPATYAVAAYGAAVLSFAIGYREPRGRELTLAVVLAAVAAPIAVYAVLQSILPLPAWDDAWIKSVDFVSAGNQEEGTLRAFGTLNSPATLAGMLGIALVFGVTAKRLTVARVAVLLLILAGLSVTLVRGVWVAVAVALILMLLLAPARVGRRVALVGLIAVIAAPLAAGGSPQAADVEQRATTFTELDTDVSAQARIATPSILVPQAIREPLGLGLGQAGEASRLGDRSVLRATDNALLSIVLQNGPVGLVLILTAVVMGFSSAWRAFRRTRRSVDLAVLASIALLGVVMLTGDVFYGVGGVVLWYLIGVAVRADDRRAPEALI